MGDGSMCKCIEAKMVLKKNGPRELWNLTLGIYFTPPQFKAVPTRQLCVNLVQLGGQLGLNWNVCGRQETSVRNCWRRAPRNGQPYVKTSMGSRLAEWNSLAVEVDSCLMGSGDACEWIVRSPVQQIDLLKPILKSQRKVAVREMPTRLTKTTEKDWTKRER